MSWSDRPTHRNLTYSQGAPLGPAVETTEIKDGSVVFWRGLRDTRWMTGFMERLDRPGQQASLGGHSLILVARAGTLGRVAGGPTRRTVAGVAS